MEISKATRMSLEKEKRRRLRTELLKGKRSPQRRLRKNSWRAVGKTGE